ncbi:DUF5819 family protein [Leucobacter luti]|uniref:Uncharacterized protein n=1 Tax=Leucobacter luti TaxID=340320 RepID=A0A4V6MBY5_9MICO|nr:DUF5819 family protein [Leucobacter luti]MBL3699996.1 hypothetical protein [Leucobacter luti]RZT62689.1 hypothetical protein EV139_2389 [Leucobacter luti]
MTDRDGEHRGRRRAAERGAGSAGIPVAAKATAGAAVVLLGAHMFLTAVYNTPSEELKYGALPGAVADRYVRPYLVQDYKIFAPDPADTDRQLWVRAWVEQPDGERVNTEWLNASHVELSEAYRKTLRKQLSVVGAERLMAAYTALNDTHKGVVAQNHLDSTELYGVNDAMVAADDSDPAAVREFIRADNFVTSYATQVAYAMWGDQGEIVGVQARAVYDPVIRWADRHDPDAERPPSRYTDLGWVPPMEWPGQDREAFARTFRAWAEQTGEDGA